MISNELRERASSRVRQGNEVKPGKHDRYKRQYFNHQHRPISCLVPKSSRAASRRVLDFLRKSGTQL